jgi:hypothetical protein
MGIAQIRSRAGISLRSASRSQYLLRAGIMAAGALALALTVAQPWPMPWLAGVVALVALIMTAIAPDQLGGPIFSGAVVASWLLRGSGELPVALLAVAASLLVLQLASALAGTAPPSVPLSTAAVGAWLPPAAIMLAGSTVSWLLLRLLGSLQIPSALPLTVLGLLIIPLGAWLLLRHAIRRP